MSLIGQEATFVQKSPCNIHPNVIISCKVRGALTSVSAIPTVKVVMNTFAPAFADATAFDGSVDATGERYGFAFFYPGFAYLYFYSLAGET